MSERAMQRGPAAGASPGRAHAFARPERGTLQRRVLGVVSGLGLALLVALLGKAWLDARQLAELLERARQDRARTFERVVELRSASLRSFVADYTPWDDMVTFAAKPDFEWGSTNLDSAPGSFALSGVWVFDAKSALVYGIHVGEADEIVHAGGIAQAGHVEEAAASEPAPAATATAPAPSVLGVTQGDRGRCIGAPPVGPAVIERLLARPERIWHWFEATPCGPLEISGGTIVPTAEDARTGTPAGTFFATRLWDAAELALLGRTVGVELSAHAGSRASSELVDSARGTMAFELPLVGLDERPVMSVAGALRAGPVAVFHSLLVGSVIGFAIVVAALIGALAIALDRYVVRPVRGLALALRDETLEPAAALLADPGELGGLARALQRHFAEQGTLAEERAGRIAAEETISALRNAQEDERRRVAAILVSTLGDLRRRSEDVVARSEGLAELAPDGRAWASVLAMRESAETISRVLDDVIAFVQAEESARSVPRLVPIDPRALLEEALDVLAIGAQARGVEVGGSTSERVPARVLGDATRLQRVIAHLARRLLRDAPPGMEILVEVDVATGAKSGRVLELALRELSTRTGAAPVADDAIALALCARELEPLGGHVVLEPDRDGRRSVCVRLPCVVPDDDLPAATGPGALAGRRVLVLDASATARRSVVATLATLGAEAEQVATAERAAARLRLATRPGERFDALVVDAQTWRASWKSLGEAFGADLPAERWPVVVMRALAAREHGPDDPERPEKPIVKKPVHRAVLAARLLEVIG